MSLKTLIDQDLDNLLASDWGEQATIAGVAVPCIFETSSDVVLGNAANSTAPALLVKSSVVVSEGDTVTVGGKTYSVVEIERPSYDTQRLYLSLDARLAV